MHKVFDNPPYVYFIQIGDSGPIKIGYSKNPIKRLRMAQVYNPCMLKLLAVEHGDIFKERELHKKFAKLLIYGEWFLPDKNLLNYINTVEKIDIVCEDFRLSPPSGDKCHNWKGELASASSKRQRGKKRHKLKEKCERCGRIALDLFHKDKNLDNNDKSNIESLCRRCRMEADGTLEKLIKAKKPNKKPDRPCKICNKYTDKFCHGKCSTCNSFFKRNGFERSEKKEHEQKSCKICNAYTNTFRKGRCHACTEFFRRNSFERSEKKEHKSKPCIICNKTVKYLAKEKCHICYEFFRRNKFERNEISELNKETDDIISLKKLSLEKMSTEKAFLIRNAYKSRKFTCKFIYESAGISLSYFNDIIRNRYFLDENYTYIPNKASKKKAK